jgi:HD superfamily phosphohydrolase
MIDLDGLHAVEQFVLAKYYMTSNVYRHRVRLITDQMIGRAILLGIQEDNLDDLRSLYEFDNTHEFIRNYQKWDDARFMETFCPAHGQPPGKKCGEVLRRLRERNLLKQVFSERIENLDARIREVVRELPSPKRDGPRSAIEKEVADFLSKELSKKPESEEVIDPGLVIVNAFDIKSVRETSRNDEEGILVNDGPTPKTFTEASTLFKSINEAYGDQFVEVYAPIRWPDPAKKDESRDNWKGHIREIIDRNCKAAKKGKP